MALSQIYLLRCIPLHRNQFEFIYKKMEKLSLIAKAIETPIGAMIAVANAKGLCSLTFSDYLPSGISVGTNESIASIEEELSLFFSGKKQLFKTPLIMNGTPFQKRVWEELKKIPSGQTISYLELATRIGNEKATRAVAKANGANHFPIVIPCHRVIYANGKLGGYSSGIDRKKWLLEHEDR